MRRWHLVLAMTELDIVGVGAWSDCFSNFKELRQGLVKGEWASDTALKPEMIPPRERRRAPNSVKMAVEVMGQASEMAGLQPSEPAVVFASAMGDMQITEAMCSILADRPELVSPTRFHNSVHNAAIGYWSIATGSHQPSTAIAGHDHNGALGLLEASVQCCEDALPVLFVCQEGSAPEKLRVIRPSAHPLALSLLLAPCGTHGKPLGRLCFEMVEDAPSPSAWGDELVSSLPLDFSGNPTVSLLPIYSLLADLLAGVSTEENTCQLSLNEHCALRVRVSAPVTTMEPV